MGKNAVFTALRLIKLKSNLTKASIKFGKFGNFYSEVKK